MFLAIAVETKKHPMNQDDYKVWFLELDPQGEVVGIGVKSKNEVVQSLFKSYKDTGKSNWRAFKKDAQNSTPVEAYDFISRNLNENTHFGNLPSLAQFQSTLNKLHMNFELKSIA